MSSAVDQKTTVAATFQTGVVPSGFIPKTTAMHHYQDCFFLQRRKTKLTISILFDAYYTQLFVDNFGFCNLRKRPDKHADVNGTFVPFFFKPKCPPYEGFVNLRM